MTKKTRFRNNTKKINPLDFVKEEKKQAKEIKKQHTIILNCLNKKTPEYLKEHQIDFKAFYKAFFPKSVYMVGHKDSPCFVSSKMAWAYYLNYIQSGLSFEEYDNGTSI